MSDDHSKKDLEFALKTADSDWGRKILAVEVRALREELAAIQRDARELGCQCTYEIGDSPCPAHPLNPATELPYTSREAGELAAKLARVEALPAKWRDDYRLGAQDVSPYDVADSLAEELEAALTREDKPVSKEDDFDAYARSCLGPDGAAEMIRETHRPDDAEPRVTVLPIAVEYGGEFVTYEQIDALVKRAKRIADMWDGYGGENVEIHWRELEALREDLEPFTRAASDADPSER